MVTAMISLAGRSSSFIATAVIRMARVESSPPDRPTTAVLAPVCSKRFFRPRAAIFKISLHRSARSSASAGTKGAGETARVSRVSSRGREKEARQRSACLWPLKVVIRRRS